MSTDLQNHQTGIFLTLAIFVASSNVGMPLLFIISPREEDFNIDIFS